MKKIWLRKEREDSKCFRESEEDLAGKVEQNKDLNSSQNGRHENGCTRPGVYFEGREDAGSLDHKFANGSTDSGAEEKINSTSNENLKPESVSDKNPNQTTFADSFHPSADGPLVQPAYILTIRRSGLPPAVQRDIDPYQLHHHQQQQVHFAVPNAFSFLPLSQEYLNKNFYDSTHSTSYDLSIVPPNDSRETKATCDAPKCCGVQRSDKSRLDNHFSYPPHPPRDVGYYYHFLNRSLITSDIRPQGGQPMATLNRAEPYMSAVRKRAPNSPLEVPLTPTTVGGRNLSSNSVYCKAFVVPRDFKHSKDNENCDLKSSEVGRQVEKGAAFASKSTNLIPRMIQDLNALEVNDKRESTSYCRRVDDGSPRGPSPGSGKPSQCFRPFETTVVSSSVSLPPPSSTSSLSSSSSSSRGSVYFTGDQVLSRERSTYEMTDRVRTNGIHSNVDANNNSKEPQLMSVATSNQKEITLGNGVVAVAVDQPPIPVSASDRKSHNASVAPPPIVATRGKGRPAKIYAKQGSEPSTNSGLRSVIKCPTCVKVFNNSSALAKHKLTHSDERKYSCHLCSKAFKRQDHLNGHMMTHSSKKPFECRFLGCSKSYCDARSLRRHLENHHQDSINSCQVPSARGTPGNTDDDAGSLRSSQSDSLAPQIPSDPQVVWAPGFNPLDEPKPVRCHVCSRRFKNVPALNGHMRLHGGYVTRDPDNDDVKQLGPSSSSEVASVAQTKVPLESHPVAFEGKMQPFSHVNYPRASSLELLPSIQSSKSSGVWIVAKDQEEKYELNSYSLLREEAKFRNRVFQGNDAIDSSNLTEKASKSNVQPADVNKMSTDGKDSQSAVIDLTKEETFYRRLYGEYINYLRNESVAKDSEDVVKVQEQDREMEKYSKHTNERPVVATDGSLRGNFKEIEADLDEGALPLVAKREISPKHLEASSLYQRRLRRISEKSPNSDESSRQSEGSPLPSDSEKSMNSKECLALAAQNTGLDDEKSRTLRKAGEVELFAIPTTTLSREDLMDDERSYKNFQFKNYPIARINCAVVNDKLSTSHPNLPHAHQTQPEAAKDSQPVAAASNDANYKALANAIATNAANVQCIFGSPNEHVGSTHQHQSHSSLPCTPYTAHTPYTPRTTEPVSPKKASFFQFPPFYQPEGAVPEGSKVDSDVDVFAFVPESCMETARIPDVHDDLGTSKGSYEHHAPDKAWKKTGTVDKKVTGCKLAQKKYQEEVECARIEKSDDGDECATGSVQEKNKEKLSARRKVRPAPLVLPPQKEMRERYFRCHSQLRSPRANNPHGIRPSYTPPPMLSPIPLGPFRTALQSSVSSIDSGCPNISARPSTDYTPSELLSQYADSACITTSYEDITSALVRNRSTSQKENEFDSSTLTTSKSMDAKRQTDTDEDEDDEWQLGSGTTLQRPSGSDDCTDLGEGRSDWSEAETKNFSQAVSLANKDFVLVSKLVGSRSVNECMEFYYAWKKKHPHDYLRFKGQGNRGRSKGKVETRCGYNAGKSKRPR